MIDKNASCMPVCSICNLYLKKPQMLPANDDTEAINITTWKKWLAASFSQVRHLTMASRMAMTTPEASRTFFQFFVNLISFRRRPSPTV